MRRTGRFLLSFAATIAATIFGAQASSFVAPEQASGRTPSIMFVGKPQGVPADQQAPAMSLPDVAVADQATASSSSVLVLGAPAVTDEKVAAIPEKRGGPRGASPLVIRAGVIGGASASNPAAAVSSASAASPQEAKAPLPPNGEQGPKTLRDAVNAGR